MLQIGHRGAQGYAPENSLKSFKKALELRVDAIELDVHLSADEHVVVIHDHSVDRTTNRKGLVPSFSAFELNQMGIPSLETVLNLVDQQCWVNIEIKDANATSKVIDIIEKYIVEHHWNYNQFQISSFIWDVLEEVSMSNSSIPIGVLTEDAIETALEFAKKISAHSINPYFKLLNTKNTKQIRENGFKIYPWTVNTEEDLIFVKSLEVDGIISDFPDKI